MNFDSVNYWCPWHDEKELMRWFKEMPFLRFPSHWLVQIMPPYPLATIRFRVKEEGMDEDVSVYMDGYNKLGFFSNGGELAPYWEIYPYPTVRDDGEITGDTCRIGLDESALLLESVQIALDYIKARKKADDA